MMLVENRAIIIEDDRSWQQILTEILSDMELVVDVASDYRTATQLITEHLHRLAVVDLSLVADDHTNQDGLRILEQIRLLDPGCMLILLTGYATVEIAVRAIKDYGAFSCLEKDNFQRRQFTGMLRDALSQQPLINRVTLQAGESFSSRHPLFQTSPAATGEIALVVEDDAGWRSILSEILNSLGYETRVCSGYGEALSILRREKFNLAVVDLALRTVNSDTLLRSVSHLSDLEGYHLLATLRSGGVPAIVVSGHGTPAEIERTFAERGVLAYIEKQNFDRLTFIAMLEDVRKTKKPDQEFASLTDRERNVLDLLVKGMSNKEIADSLVITTNTVKRHLKSIYEKLGIHTRSAAAARAAQRNSMR
jgi:DNA-binding NarL/FixJ family response regulator